MDARYAGFDYAGATYEELEAHAMWQDARVAALEGIIAELYPYVGSTCPDGCRYQGECDEHPNICIAFNRYHERLHELGIEVDDG